MTLVSAHADRGGGWRSAPYVFVDVDEVGQGPDGVAVLLAVAIVGCGDDPGFCCRIDTGGSLRRQAPVRPGREAVGPEALPPPVVCPALVDRLRDRVAVVHGTRIGWRLLVLACPQIRPLAVLDSLALARALLPGGATSLPALARRLDVRISEAELHRAGRGEASRNADTLARVFERLVDTMLPGATIESLLHLSGRDTVDPLPELGLENGP